MAGTYEILAQAPAFELVPPNKLRKVTEITGRALPSGIVFYFRVLPAAYTKAHVAAVASGIAEGLNKDANVPGVVGITIEQDVGANNEIREMGVVTVESSSGNSTAEIRELQTFLYLETFPARVAALRDKLDSIEAL